MTHEPVRTVADLATLDRYEIVEGYLDGFKGDPEPGGNRSRSYWHGWRNGAYDAKRIPKDDAMAALARDLCPRGEPLFISPSAHDNLTTSTQD